MPDSQNPSNPNFTPGVGRLVTDRYDFQSHVNGTAFRHDATMIDMHPVITINGGNPTTVQAAIQALQAIVEPPSLALATSTTPGIVQLSPGGDVVGSALVMRVRALQGYSVSTAGPALNNVLTWNGSSWTPQATQGVFTAGGDLGGTVPASTNSSQYVSGISGNSGLVTISANNFNFVNTVTPSFTQTAKTSGTGNNFYIEAQGVSGTGNSGSLYLMGGLSPVTEGGSGLPGGVALTIAGNPSTESGQIALQVAQVVSGQNIAAFFPNDFTNGISSTDMPSGTGNDVIYIGNSSSGASVPSSTGTILYSQSGALWIMQSDGTNFQIGSVPNPSTWGTLGSTQGQTITYRSFATSSTSAGTNIFSAPLVNIPTDTSARVDCIFVAKVPGTSVSAQYNVSMAFTNSGGTVGTLGSNTITDPRTLALIGHSWNNPSISHSGTSLSVTTGWYDGANANWTVITQITLTPQG